MSSIKSADISWRNDKTPLSNAYDDVYFSADDGAAESHFVFIENNHLPERFESIFSENPADPQHFVVAETGFGTGLNFIQTAALWRRHARAQDQLTFISCELHPLKKDDLAQSLKAWPDFQEISNALIAQYPPLVAGTHSLALFDNVHLTLLFDDVLQGFGKLLENAHCIVKPASNSKVDAWFLDGFAPSKNPEMWRDALYNLMARFSTRETTFASFTAAGIVRRGLKGAGFTVKKVKGFGKKRDMIQGRYVGLPSVFEDIIASTRATRCEPFWPIYRQSKKPRNAIVIGAGIAGCTTAEALIESGIDTRVIDKNAAPMLEASGNPQGVLFPKLSHKEDMLTQFNLFSLLYALRYYQQPDVADGFFNTGMLQLLNKNDASHKALHQRFNECGIAEWVGADRASEIAGTRVHHSAIWYPQTGWIRQSILRSYFSDLFKDRFVGETDVQSIQQKSDGTWVVSAAQSDYQADMVVICNASASNTLITQLDVDGQLPAKAIRGQVTEFSSAGLPKLNTVICHKGYICPPADDEPEVYTCGATYDLNDASTTLKAESQATNLSNLSEYLPEFESCTSPETPLAGRVAFRCTTPDYLPMTGPLPKIDGFQSDYALLKKNAKSHIPVAGNYHERLFVNIGHGSRGFGSAPIAAKIIAAYATQSTFPLPFDQVTALNPARFLIRDMIRNRR